YVITTFWHFNYPLCVCVHPEATIAFCLTITHLVWMRSPLLSEWFVGLCILEKERFSEPFITSFPTVELFSKMLQSWSSHALKRFLCALRTHDRADKSHRHHQDREN